MAHFSSDERKELQPGILSPIKIFFQNEDEKKKEKNEPNQNNVKNSFSEGKLRKFVANRAAFKEQLTDVLHKKEMMKRKG